MTVWVPCRLATVPSSLVQGFRHAAPGARRLLSPSWTSLSTCATGVHTRGSAVCSPAPSSLRRRHDAVVSLTARMSP
eukprot:8015632-Pyramimonas_sp.AAC.1